MTEKKRLYISFGRSKEDQEVYRYLKEDVSNASALIRMLVSLYKDGHMNITATPNEYYAGKLQNNGVKDLIREKVKESEASSEEPKEDFKEEPKEEPKIVKPEISEEEIYNRFGALKLGKLY